MRHKALTYIIVILLGGAFIGSNAAQAYLPASKHSLAEHVPADVQLFLEMRDIQELADTEAGAAVISMLVNLMTTSTKPPQTQPSRELDWRILLAKALGLPNITTVDLLFSSRMAIAAQKWDQINDAVLLFKPADLVELEKQFSKLLVPQKAEKNMRRYRLGRRHELACNGKIAIIGLKTRKGSNLYRKTVDMTASGEGIRLGQYLDFDKLKSAIPASSQIMMYATAGGSGKSKGLTADWWPTNWPQLTSVAIGLNISPVGITVEANGRLHPRITDLKGNAPPIHVLSLLPESTVVAWTHTIDYVEEFRKLNARHSKGLVRLYIDLLKSGLPNEALEGQLLSHLKGDTIFLVGQTQKLPQPEEQLTSIQQLPALAMVAETESPGPVEKTLLHVAGNILRLFNLPQEEKEPYRISSEPLERGEGTLYSIPIGQLFSGGSNSPLFQSLQISWTVADHLLIVSTHSAMVREIIGACRGQQDWMPDDALLDAIQRVNLVGGSPKMMLTAQPQVASKIIDTWLEYLAHHHPEVFQPDWWQKLRRKQNASSVQLGILPVRKSKLSGQVKVAQTLPNWPAHKRLQPNDIIVSVDGQKLSPVNALRSLRLRLATREDPEKVKLGIIRDGKKHNIVIPMPAKKSATDHLQPIQLFRQASNFLKNFSTASYITWQPSPGTVGARLELKFTPTLASHSVNNDK